MSKINPNPVIQPLAGTRHSDESDAAVLAFNDYLRLGPQRSLRKLAVKAGETRQNTADSASSPSLNTMEGWSGRFEWQTRASLYDAEWERQRNEIHVATMLSGMALPYARIERLKQLWQVVAETVDEQDDEGNYVNVMLLDPKNIIREDAEGNPVKDKNGKPELKTAHYPRFNAALLAEERALLSELAKETGGRQLEAPLAIPAVEVDEVDFSDFTDEELNTYAALRAKAREKFKGHKAVGGT